VKIPGSVELHYGPISCRNFCLKIQSFVGDVAVVWFVYYISLLNGELIAVEGFVIGRCVAIYAILYTSQSPFVLGYVGLRPAARVTSSIAMQQCSYERVSRSPRQPVLRTMLRTRALFRVELSGDNISRR